VVYALDTNIQRFFYHSDDVTSLALLVRRYQKQDGSWEELTKPLSFKAREEWSKWFAYSSGVHVPNAKAWSSMNRTLPVHSDEWPCERDGMPYDWRTWDLPSRCIVASGQKGRNPRIYVWRIVNPRGASMSVGACSS